MIISKKSILCLLMAGLLYSMTYSQEHSNSMDCSQEHTSAILLHINAIMADKSSCDKNLNFYLTKAEALRHSDNKDIIDYAHNIYFLIITRIRELDNMPKSRAYMGLAKIASRKLHHEDALIWARAALRCNPDNEYISIWYAQYPPLTQDTKTKIFLLLQCLQSNDIIIQARASIGLGNARYTDDTHGKQTDWYLQALDLLEDHPDKSLTAQALIGLGNARYTDDTHENNTDWYLQALDLLEDHPDKSLTAKALIGLGNAARAAGNNEQAISHYQAVIELQSGKHLIKKASNGIDIARRFLRQDPPSKSEA